MKYVVCSPESSRLTHKNSQRNAMKMSRRKENKNVCWVSEWEREREEWRKEMFRCFLVLLHLFEHDRDVVKFHIICINFFFKCCWWGFCFLQTTNNVYIYAKDKRVKIVVKLKTTQKFTLISRFGCRVYLFMHFRRNCQTIC
jgi:hypothetical protein